MRLRVVAGRTLLAFLAAAGGFAAVGVAPRWLTPEPSVEALLARLHDRDWSGANDLVPALLLAREGDPVAALLYAFPRGIAGATVERLRGRAVALFPRGRVHDSLLAFRFHDFRGPGAAPSDRIELRGEAAPARTLGPLSPGATLALLPPNETLGPPGAVGEWRLFAGREALDHAIYEVLPVHDRRVVSEWLADADVLGDRDPVSTRYLHAMTYARAGCAGDALAALEAVLSLSPGDPFLEGAREHLAERLLAVP